MLNRAFTSGFNGADGVTLANTAHPTVTGLTYSNAANPAADLSEASLEDGMIAIRGFFDDKGLFADVHVKCLVIPRQLLYTATRILKSPYQSQTANNDINALKYTGAIPEIVESIYLTSPGAWFLVTDTGGSGKGLIYQERMAVAPHNDNDFDTLNYKAGLVERYAVGWDNPRCLYASNGP
jgi:phage major head subunit gpT-like protein